jgi:hypothetical protein
VQPAGLAGVWADGQEVRPSATDNPGSKNKSDAMGKRQWVDEQVSSVTEEIWMFRRMFCCQRRS